MLLLSGLRNHMESDQKVVRINEVQALRSFRERAACLQREVTKCTMGRWHQGLIFTGAELLGAVTWPHLVLELERRGLATGLAGRGSSTMSPPVATHVPAALGASAPSLELAPTVGGHGAGMWWPPEGENHLQNRWRWSGWW